MLQQYCDGYKNMRVEQLFDPASSTYSYLVWDPVSREAALVDPVLEQAGRDTGLIRELKLTLRYTLETHMHADHITGAGYLREVHHSIVIVHENSRSKYADVMVKDGDYIPLGQERINILHTPGHTDNHICLTIPGAVFTGDSLHIGSCGRTDYTSSDAGLMYDSIINKLFTLPDDTRVYPGHDYLGKTCSTIGEEKQHNPRIGMQISRDEFISRMSDVKLAPPHRIHEALPSNLQCGMPGYQAIRTLAHH
jgi:glyoxylase-like metal-dependent hydrolase (beta-lactamase superfamily II)